MSVPKKRKLRHIQDETYPVALISDLEEELDLEIALRNRLLDTLESRIAWAITLKEILNDSEGNTTPEAFRNVALDTLQVIDSQSDIILCHEPRPPFLSKVTRPPPRKPVASSHVKTRPSFLFIRSSALPVSEVARKEDNPLFLLKCPQCSKTSFTSLQGLLNHARLVHNLEWGSHEECITACATPDNDLDIANGTEVGIGPTGILPGLRNIFQMAVGARSTENGRGLVAPRGHSFPTPTNSAALAAPASLNATLGLHEETPALAMFLGKEPVRREIKVTEEDEVDIESMTSACPHGISPSSRWRMPFAQRHVNELSHFYYEPQNTENASTAALGSSTNSPLIINTVSAQSRFHMVSRITITDRSLWIPPEHRLPEHQQYTHKWMISIDSPSYTHHITSILNSVQVTVSDSSNNNKDTAIQVPLTPVVPKTRPPFVVVGLASFPFLGKIILTFAGARISPTSSDSPPDISGPEQVFVFEHWIDLYPLPASHIIKGQDQVVDIDLDKDTLIRSPNRNYTPIDSKSLWMQPLESDPAQAVLPLTDPVNTRNDYENKLFELSKLYPITLQDFQGRRSKPPKVPYMLASSLQHYLSFVTGRRKAIEWGRARAIHDAYTQSLHRSSHDVANLIPLTVTDVYSWLDECGYLPRPDPKKVQHETPNPNDRVEDIDPKIWCRFCGLDMKVHDKIAQFNRGDSAENTSKKSEGIESNQTLSRACPISVRESQVFRIPRIGIKPFLSRHRRAANHGAFTIDLEWSALLGIAEPSVIVHIHDLTKRWDLRTFHESSGNSENQPRHPRVTSTAMSSVMALEPFGHTRKAVETRLAPHALLALLAEKFIRAVVSHGLEVANQDKYMALASRRRGKNQLNSLLTTRLLTPTHILAGVSTPWLGKDAEESSFGSTFMQSLSKLGFFLEEGVTHAPGRQDGSPSKIKEEE